MKFGALSFAVLASIVAVSAMAHGNVNLYTGVPKYRAPVLTSMAARGSVAAMNARLLLTLRRATLASCAILFVAPAATAAEGLPTDDPTLRPYQLTTKEYIGRCNGRDLSHVEQSGCYFDQIKALRARVTAEVKKALIDADAEKDTEEIGGRTGAERAKLARAEIQKSQATWNAYTQATCGAVLAQSERGGGNGGDLAAGACYIRHLVARLNELTRN